MNLTLPMPYAWLGAACSAAAQRIIRRSSVFNLDKIREATAASWAASNRWAKKLLEWEPAKPLRARLCETAQWHLANDWL
ncbi:MAG: hypothetical protein QGG36_23425 [Pirellulaceae bacterium]|jgi:hypothetical protein|nr:hypothetical protein [Pirellulaceae bacterium]